MTTHPPFGQPKPIPEAKPAEDPNAEKNWEKYKPGIQINSVTGKLRTPPKVLWGAFVPLPEDAKIETSTGDRNGF